MTILENTDTPAEAATPASGLVRFGLYQWLREGLRAGLLMRPRLAGQQPAPMQLVALIVFLELIIVGLSRLEVDGPASFQLRYWLAPWWATSAMLLLAWWALPPPTQEQHASARPAGLATWFLLFTVAMLPAELLAQALLIARGHEAFPFNWRFGAWVAWAIFLVLWAWFPLVAVALARRFGASTWRVAVLALGIALISSVNSWQFSERPWWPDQSELSNDDRERLHLSQETFETQQRVWNKALAGLVPERPGVIDVYGLVFAPYASEDVFKRESSMVASLLAERFDAKGRVLHLINHASTTATQPWATPVNLERAIAALARRMDRKRDVLVVYLTSHGASSFKLAAGHWPLEVDPLSPERLRAALDKAGIQNRVIAVSACYSGGWIDPLATESTLLMTAANAQRTSYGCGRLSALTFFGRAVFDEQLRATYSFEHAFSAAAPIIAQREKEAGKSDGFSDPQISVGRKIRPVLEALAQRLTKQDATRVATAVTPARPLGP